MTRPLRLGRGASAFGRRCVPSTSDRTPSRQETTMNATEQQLRRSDEYRAAGYWGDDTFVTLIDKWADADPNHPYVSDGSRELSYGEFRDQANRLAAVMIPIVVVYRAGEVGFIVENAGAVGLITCGEFRRFNHAAMAREIAETASSLKFRVVVRGEPTDGAKSLDDLLSTQPDASVLPPPPLADDRHLILYSSGTESQPKGCLHTWNTVSFLPKQAVQALGMTRSDVMFMPSPVTHALGLTLGVMAPTVAGASVHLLDVFDPQTALKRVGEAGCTGTASPAPFLRMMLDAYDPSVHDLSRLRFWLSAGAAIPAALVEEAAEKFSGCRVVSAYGSSETMMATICRPEDPVERVASSDGRPVPGVEIRIIGDDDKPVGPGEDGEIRYRGPGRMLEYWRRPDLTAAATDDEGWWRTGD